MKLKNILENLSLSELNSIMTLWGIQKPTLDPSFNEQTCHVLIIEHLYTRLQQEHYFNTAWDNIDKSEKEFLYFLTIHGGDMSKEELLVRYFKRREKLFIEMTEKLISKALIYSEDLSNFEPNLVLIGIPEAYIKFIDLPPYWRGYLGYFLKDLSTIQLNTIASQKMKIPIKFNQKNYIIFKIREFLLNPSNLKRYIDSLPENEYEIMKTMLDKKGICVYRDLLEMGYLKRYDHSKAEFINNLLAYSGLLYTAVPNPNKYHNLLMVPKDIYYIASKGYKEDKRGLKALETASSMGKEAQPQVVLNNANSLLRDIVIFANFINKNIVKQLSNGGIGRNDLKKALPLMSKNKSLKYAGLIALFMIEKRFIIGVGGNWKISNNFVKWLDNSQQCYRDFFQYWLDSTSWNEEFIDGNTAHAEVPLNNLINISELRKLILKNIVDIPIDHWVNFHSFVESLIPQIDVQIPKRPAPPAPDKNNRSIYLILESLIGESFYWLGLIHLGLNNTKEVNYLGNRMVIVTQDLKGKNIPEEKPIRFFFKLTDLAENILTHDYLNPQKLFKDNEGQTPTIQPLKYEVNNFIIQPNLEVIAPPDLSLRTFYHLTEFSEIKNIDVMSVLTITKESLREGMDRGLKGEDILNFLNKSCGQNLPETVKHLIAECSYKHGEVNMGFTGGYIFVEDPILLEELKTNKKIREATKDIIDNKLILLNPDVNVAKLAKDLQKAGFMPQIDSEYVHVTTEGKYHLTFSEDDLYYLIGALKFILNLEENLGKTISEDKITPLLERLKPPQKTKYSLNFFAETIAKRFEKRFEELIEKRIEEVISKYKRQVSSLMKSSTRTALSKYSFKGPNPAESQQDIRSMIEFSIENSFEIEIKYTKSTNEEITESIEPESMDRKKILAYGGEGDSLRAYRIDRIKKATLL